MLTLQELKQMTDIPKRGKKIPTAKYLRENGTVISKKQLGKDVEITAYQNGYALYQVGRHFTVFPIHSCENYLYISNARMIHLPGTMFDDEMWHVRLALEGEDRLNRNQEERERGKTISYSAVSEEWNVMEDAGQSMQEQFETQETVEEILRLLTERQRMVVIRFFLQEKTQRQISRELGISSPAVSTILSQAIQRIRKRYPSVHRKMQVIR